MIQDGDLKAALKQGLITEQQAEGLRALAGERQESAERSEDAKEPFSLFRGLNEIFIVVGLCILFGGWIALFDMWDNLPYFGTPFLKSTGHWHIALISTVTLGALIALQYYFTARRKMVAPSIALAIMTALSSGVLAVSLLAGLGVFGIALGTTLTGALVSAIMFTHYRLFRLPFDALLIGGALLFAVMVGLEAAFDTPLKDHRLFQLAPLTFGFTCFALAMRFDLSDPHRLSARADTGFWLHVLAAPTIIAPAYSWLSDYGGLGFALFGALMAVLAFVAVVIDRRSFLISGSGYILAVISWWLDEGFNATLAVVTLGAGLVLLGAFWSPLRNKVMRALPPFPGKDNLPPYMSTAQP